MKRQGDKYLAKMAERKALSDAGINPDDVKAVTDHNKDARKEKSDKFAKIFCKCIVDFDKHGVTDTTVSNFIVAVLRKKEKNSDEPNKAGTELLNAAVKAVLRSRGVSTAKIAEAVGKLQESKTQAEVHEALKKAAHKK